ncbi:metallophosphoesterase [Flavobacteriaceae bacterium F89]|uniref:Metallophosphoesterase n=1 Tax=Cerina litoralis TaxID=2874477 RepID=A0AAE3EXK9_9FLAO|nr:metallophosphoesterase [Cerina litoralis]MCG2462355.1 metallophosphoesterase [Cerina litoralis]
MNFKFKQIGLLCVLFYIVISCLDTKNKNANQQNISPVVFSAIGDVPYGDVKRTELIDYIKEHNAKSRSEFIIHLGDIKPGNIPCNEYLYKDVDSILRNFKTPTFIILGDNEFNDCEDPDEAFHLWKKYFLHFNENWSFDYTVSYQKERIENFSWIENKVLFIGINLVGSLVHDKNEWEQRLTDDGNFIQELLVKEKNRIEAVVVFAHANILIDEESSKFKIFTDIFLPAAKNFNKPVLFLHGDGHVWLLDKPWSYEHNITRVQVEAGAIPLQITVDTSLEYPFIFSKSF